MGSGDKFNTEGIQSHPGQEGKNGGGGEGGQEVEITRTCTS